MTATAPLPGATGTRLRALLDAMDADVADTLAELGLTDYRPRYSAVIRAVQAGGPAAIGDLAAMLGVTHSAASQTVGMMRRRGLVELAPGPDARTRLVRLTGSARQLLPVIDAEWEATRAAAGELGRELSVPLETMVAELSAALARRPFRRRIAAHLATERSTPGPRVDRPDGADG